MHTEPKDSLVLPRKIGDRLLLFVFSCVLTGFFALMSLALRERTVTGWLGSLLYGIAVETMFTF